jgi:hypothetical protein
MVIAPLSMEKDYWQNFDVEEQDLEFLYNYLLEVEQPQPTEKLLEALVSERIRLERASLEQQQQAIGDVYLPKERYQVGQSIQIPALDWQVGKVISIRSGNNPELPVFEVIEVELESGEKRLLASGLEDHKLNQPVTVDVDDPQFNPATVLEQHGEQLTERLSDVLEANPDIVRIGWMWFPRALLVDINVGHLNLAEAVLDMMGGGPLPTSELMEQIDMPTDVDARLNEFSLNLALQEDKRFDEVGPAGEVLWYLHRLEPEPVREAPLFLRYSGTPDEDDEALEEALGELEAHVIDELQPGLSTQQVKGKEAITLALLYPHWRAGTLPLAGGLEKLFPTAFESPRIQFTFVDGYTGEKFSGWVVRPHKYVYGLREWYLAQGAIAGSRIHVRHGDQPGEVIIRTDKKRGSRDWVRTAVVGSDGGVVFSMLRQSITAAVDERMAIAVPDVEAMDQVWEKNSKNRPQLAYTVRQVMTELVKHSPQSHVHAQELYACVNVLRRCPPGPILRLLLESPWANHLGNLYFRLEDTSGGDTA